MRVGVMAVMLGPMLVVPRVHRAPDGLDAGDRVGLAPVEMRIVDRGDRAGVVQERVLVPNPGREPKLEGEVGLAATVVADVDVVQDIVAELIEVRPRGRRLKRK